MTLLLVIISVTNIAIGYWLAVHLGHARVRWAPAERAAGSQPAVEQPPSEAARQDEHDIAPAPAVAAQPLAEPIAPEPVMVSPVNEAVEPTAVVDEVPAAAVVDESPVPEAAETEEVAAEAEVLNSVEAVRAEIHDQPAPATMVEALANEAEPESRDAAQEEAPVKSKPVSKEALMESIGAFQEQLKKQRELSKLYPASGSEDS